jgi:hypothetical protein
MGVGPYAEWGGERIKADNADIDRVTTHIIEEGPHQYSARPMTPERIRAMVAATMNGTA